MNDEAERILIELENQALRMLVLVMGGTGISSPYKISECGDELHVKATTSSLEYYCKFTSDKPFTREEAITMIGNHLEGWPDDI